jgi:signal recognition particle receptor subunit beta
MPVVNHTSRDVQFKVVYCGPGMGGKTSNLLYIHSRLGAERRGDLCSLATRTDRTIFFDFLPVNATEINGYKVRFQLYTVPGQACFSDSRSMVLKGVDGVVFVADSRIERRVANIEAMEMVRGDLGGLGISLDALPWVLQYNKRDLSDLLPREVIDHDLGLAGRQLPRFEVCATSGFNVFGTLDLLSRMILHRFYASMPDGRARAPGRAESEVALSSH